MARSDVIPPITEETLDDPILRMVGVGKHLWKHEPGDDFIDRLRADEPPPPPATPSRAGREKVTQAVWQRITRHQGEKFKTATGRPFTYKMDGSGMWFFREEHRINRRLTRTQLEAAVSRCPLTTTTEIRDLMDYPYVFGLLTDSRIRAQDW